MPWYLLTRTAHPYSPIKLAELGAYWQGKSASRRSASMMHGIAMPPLLLRQGAHPRVAQERPGHSTIATTLDVYSHVTPGIQEAVAARFDEAMSDGYNNQSKTNRQLVANS